MRSLDFLLFRSNLIILVPLVEIISYLASLWSASGQFSGNKTTKKPKHIMIMPASFIPSNVASYKKLSMTERSRKGLRILFVLQNSWHIWTVEEYFRVYFICTAKFLAILGSGGILRSILFALQNSWHFWTVEEYLRIYFICTSFIPSNVASYKNLLKGLDFRLGLIGWIRIKFMYLLELKGTAITRPIMMKVS